MPPLAATALIGFVAGVLSGMFGVGGGVLTTPAMRLLLEAPALVAVGTPLPVIIPTALTGAYAYAKRGLIDIRAGVAIGLWGSAAAVTGAYLSDVVGGTVVMFVTAGLILFMAGDLIRQAISPVSGPPAISEHHPKRGVALAILGLATGLYSGFLGLGGGFVLVPLLSRWFGFPIKRAIGTSLIAVAILAVPGTVAHAALGHVDYLLALGLMLGVVPGALLGARLTAAASDKAVRIGFAGLLVVTGVLLALNELGIL